MANTTETLEPIVGNSPKELPVPQFNRDEILAVVQDGIDKGKVDIPKGTKLYVHDIKDTSAQNHVIIISTESRPYTFANNTTPPYSTYIKDFDVSKVVDIKTYVSGIWRVYSAAFEFAIDGMSPTTVSGTSVLRPTYGALGANNKDNLTDTVTEL